MFGFERVIEVGAIWLLETDPINGPIIRIANLHKKEKDKEQSDRQDANPLKAKEGNGVS